MSDCASGCWKSAAQRDSPYACWSRDPNRGPPGLALCTTHRPEPALAVLRAIRDGRLAATPAVVIGNRDSCRGVAEQFGVDWHLIGDADGKPDNDRLAELFDEYDVDYHCAGALHADSTRGHVLEICRRPDHQLASRPVAVLSRANTLRRRPSHIAC